MSVELVIAEYIAYCILLTNIVFSVCFVAYMIHVHMNEKIGRDVGVQVVEQPQAQVLGNNHGRYGVFRSQMARLGMSRVAVVEIWRVIRASQDGWRNWEWFYLELMRVRGYGADRIRRSMVLMEYWRRGHVASDLWITASCPPLRGGPLALIEAHQVRVAPEPHAI